MTERLSLPRFSPAAVEKMRTNPEKYDIRKIICEGPPAAEILQEAIDRAHSLGYTVMLDDTPVERAEQFLEAIQEHGQQNLATASRPAILKRGSEP